MSFINNVSSYFFGDHKVLGQHKKRGVISFLDYTSRLLRGTLRDE